MPSIPRRARGRHDRERRAPGAAESAVVLRTPDREELGLDRQSRLPVGAPDTEGELGTRLEVANERAGVDGQRELDLSLLHAFALGDHRSHQDRAGQQPRGCRLAHDRVDVVGGDGVLEALGEADPGEVVLGDLGSLDDLLVDLDVVGAVARLDRQPRRGKRTTDDQQHSQPDQGWA